MGPRAARAAPASLGAPRRSRHMSTCLQVLHALPCHATPPATAHSCPPCTRLWFEYVVTSAAQANVSCDRSPARHSSHCTCRADPEQAEEPPSGAPPPCAGPLGRAHRPCDGEVAVAEVPPTPRQEPAALCRGYEPGWLALVAARHCKYGAHHPSCSADAVESRSSHEPCADATRPRRSDACMASMHAHAGG